MRTKYGEMNNELLIKYLERLIAKVFKILPLKENESDTLHLYLKSLLRELIGNKSLIEELKHNGDFLSLLGTLENLLNENDVSVYKSDVFKCISIIKRIQSSIKGEDWN